MAEKALLSLKVQNDSLTRQLELAKQNIQQFKVSLYSEVLLFIRIVCLMPKVIYVSCRATSDL